MQIQDIVDDANAVGVASTALGPLRDAHSAASAALTLAQTAAAQNIAAVQATESGNVNAATSALAVADANLAAGLKAESDLVAKIIADATALRDQDNPPTDGSGDTTGTSGDATATS